jgi:hypothetical protein
VLHLLAFFRIREKSAQRGFEFRPRVVLAVGRVIERAAVDQAVEARRDQIRYIVDELAPFRALGEPRFARARDQLARITAAVGRVNGGK